MPKRKLSNMVILFKYLPPCWWFSQNFRRAQVSRTQQPGKPCVLWWSSWTVPGILDIREMLTRYPRKLLTKQGNVCGTPRRNILPCFGLQWAGVENTDEVGHNLAAYTIAPLGVIRGFRHFFLQSKPAGETFSTRSSFRSAPQSRLSYPALRRLGSTYW